MIESPKAVFEILGRNELDRIHAATLEVLERIGVRVEEETAFNLLKEVGADVFPSEKLVKIPHHLVDESIRSASRTIRFAGRNEKYDLRLEGKKVHFGSGEGCINILDHETGAVRPCKKSDIVSAVRLLDGLPNFDFVMPVFTAQDVPPPTLPLHDLHAALENTEKPIMVVDFRPRRKLLDQNGFDSCRRRRETEGKTDLGFVQRAYITSDP